MISGRNRNHWVQAEITSAEPEKILYILSSAGIRMERLFWADMLTVRFFCIRRDCARMRIICEKYSEAVRFGPDAIDNFWRKSILCRPVLTAGLIILLLMTFFLPTRVLFFRVEGNERIPTRQILEEMENCGIRFGISRRAVRSEKMKNALLEAIPELKWAGINTTGCTAVISVREREIQQEQEHASGVTCIVAATDGYITSSTVVKGTGLCEPGQIVREGQMLISGYADHGICIQATGAEGEVFAQTYRNADIVTPVHRLYREEELERDRRLYLILGKKRINLWKDSRIWDATCGRMYGEYYVTLPGGFRLPICLGIETLTEWKTSDSEWPDRTLKADLGEYARLTVLRQTIAGSILCDTQFFIQENGIYRVKSRFLCSEMIGRVVTEEIGEINGKTD